MNKSFSTPTNSQPNNDQTEKTTAKVIIVVHDQGGGFNMCGHCNQIIEHFPSTCPHCGTKLEGSEVAPATGGSDF